MINLPLFVVLRPVRTLFLFLLSLILWHPVKCQVNYVLKAHLNGDNLLPQNTARDLAFSQNGFLWIATEDGLVCYDGLNTVTFETENSNLSKNRMKCLLKTQEGELYAVNEDRNCYLISDHPPTPVIQFTTCFTSLNKYNSSSMNLAPAKMQSLFSMFDSLNSNKSFTMNLVCAPDGNSGILKHPAGILYFNLKKGLSVELNLVDFQRWQMGFTQGYFVLYHPSGKLITLLSANGERGHQSEIPAKAQMIWDDKTNQLFFRSDRQLFELSIEKDGQIKRNLLIQELPQDQILTVTTGWNKHLIVGTATDGLFIYHQPGFKVIQASGVKKSFYAQAVLPDSNSVLCGPELTIYSPTIEKKLLPLLRSNDFYFYSHPDGSIYFCLRNVLSRFIPSSGRVDSVTSIPSGQADQIYLAYPVDQDRMLLLSGNGVYLYTQRSIPQWLCAFPKQETIHQPISIRKKPSGTFLIGTTAGLFELNVSTKQLRQIYSTCPVRCLFPLGSDRFLVGTYGRGLFILDKQKIFKIPIDHKNFLHYTHSIFEDNHGYLWFTSNHGLFTIQKNKIQQLQESDSLNDLEYYQYTPMDGLPTNEFNGGCYPSSLQLKHQIWSLPTMKGLVWFKPDSLHSYPILNAILIRQLEINGKSFPISKGLRQVNLERSSSQISIQLSSPHWSDAGNLIFEYGITSDTSYIDYNRKSYGNNPLILQNLQGGTHYLCIRRVSFHDHEEKRPPLILKLIVPKAPYEYWWFYLLCFFLLVGLVVFYNRWSNILIRRKKKLLEDLVAIRTSDLRDAIQEIEKKKEKIETAALALQKENEFKSNIIKLLSHDIATPLRFINSFLRNGSSVHTEKNPIDQNDLIDLRIATTNLEALLNNIVAWIKNTSANKLGPHIEQVDLYQIVTEKIQLFHLAGKKKQIEFSIDIPPHTLLETDAFILATAIQNVLGNAINYTRNGCIIFQVQKNSISTSILIINPLPGKTFQPQHLEIENAITGYGMGLKITQSLLNEVGGSLTLSTDVEHHQTLVKIIIPTYVGTR